MDKRIQALLLVVIFSFAASARLEVLGWLMLFGFGSVVFFGLIHFVIHFYCMNSLAIRNSKNIVRILISHLLFASILLFQMDFDDSRSYSVLGNFFGFQSEFLERNGYSIVGFSLLLYTIQSVLMIRNIKKNRIKGANNKLMLISALLAFILPNVYAAAGFKYDEHQQNVELEGTGEYNSISRALKNRELVETLTIDSYYESLTEFPSEILELVALNHLNLKGHQIESIPDDISRLRNLQTINLLDNNLQAINPSICDCENLVELRVGGNIPEIPECLKKMSTLKHLSFQSTQANELLDELLEFKNIETAHFYLKTRDVDFNSMTDEETKEYFKNSPKFDTDKWREISEETGIKHKY